MRPQFRHLLFCFAGAAALAAFAQTPDPDYDLLLKGGHVIDGKNGLNAVRDVAVKDGKIAAVAVNIPANKALKTVDVKGLYVTPGLIDIHVHVYQGPVRNSYANGDNGLFPDGYCLRNGVTTVADRVVERIAAHAAAEIAHADGLSRRVVGKEFGARRVRASADIDGAVASLRLELAVLYPASVRATTRAVRAHVARTVSRLCAVRVDHIDITVAVLRRPDQERRRVL